MNVYSEAGHYRNRARLRLYIINAPPPLPIGHVTDLVPADTPRLPPPLPERSRPVRIPSALGERARLVPIAWLASGHWERCRGSLLRLHALVLQAPRTARADACEPSQAAHAQPEQEVRAARVEGVGSDDRMLRTYCSNLPERYTLHSAQVWEGLFCTASSKYHPMCGLCTQRR